MRFTYRCLWVSIITAGLLLAALPFPNTSLAAPELPVAPAAVHTDGITQTVTASRPIVPGEPIVMGATGVTLAFDPGASGEVSVTRVPTTPVNPPAGGSIDRSWFITTSAESYAVTATFGHPQTTPVDLVIAFDKSGSMEYDTLCYGCWVPQAGEEYPDGRYAPLPWDGPPYGPPVQCSQTGDAIQTVVRDDYSAMLIEAEDYSWRNHPIERQAGYTYWVMQRNGYITDPYAGYLGRAGAEGRDAQGAYISHFPYVIGINRTDGTSGVPCVWNDIVNGVCNDDPWVAERIDPLPDPPRVSYDFLIPPDAEGGDTWYFWIKAQGGDPGDGQDPNYSGQGIYWGLSGGEYGAYTIPTGHGEINRASRDDHFKYNGAYSGYWTWRRLMGGAGPSGGSSGFALTRGVTYTLHLVAGSSGFSVDQIVITNYGGDVPISGLTPNNYRSGAACDPCDERYGGHPDGMGNEADLDAGESPLPRCDEWSGAHLPAHERFRLTHPMYDDEQWFAHVAASTVRLMRGVDIQQHQLGLVRYGTQAEPCGEILCIQADEQGHLTGGCTEDVMENTIFNELIERNHTFAEGSTNIADALDNATTMLKTDAPHYGRTSALPVIVLMTDGQPNCPNTSSSNRDCRSTSVFRSEDRDCINEALPESLEYLPDNEAYRCAIYFAFKARDRGILIHTVSMGPGADTAFMQAVADLTGGTHYVAPTIDDVDVAFADIERTFAALPAGALYHRESVDAPWQMYPLSLTTAAPFSVTARGITQLSEWTLGPLPVLMTATPASLTADGVATSTVVATVLDGYWSNLWPAAETLVTFNASLGSVVPITALTTGGVATATFTTGLDIGHAVVTATTGRMTGAVSIALVPDAPDAVELLAEDNVLPANGLATTVLSAAVSDVYGHPVADDTPVTFATTRGALAPQVSTTHNGVATTTLTAGLIPGSATLSATAGNAGDTLVVTFTESLPHAVVVHAASPTLPADGQSATLITATINDERGYPVANGTPVTFATTLGALVPNGTVILPPGTITLPTRVGQTLNGVATATLTASLDLGIAEVSAAAGEVSGTTEVAFVPLAPHTVSVQEDPASLPADGESTATITATITDLYAHPVSDGTPVTLATTLGTLTPGGTATLPPRVRLTQGGIVSITLTASLDVGIAEVSATAGDVSGTVSVPFVPLEPYTVSLQVHPTLLPADGHASAAVTATVNDEHGHPVVDGTPVTFTATLGSVPPQATTVAGLVTATFITEHTPGRASVTAAVGQVQATAWLDLYAQLYLPLVLRQ